MRKEGESDLLCQVSVSGQSAILGEPPCPCVDNGEVDQAGAEDSGISQ